MAYRIVVLAQAKRDIRSIARWLASRSPIGAANWLAALDAALEKLSQNPQGFGIAPERPRVTFDIRQILFKTRRGKRYRAVYLIVDDEVRILRVRRPGHRPLRKREIPLE